MLQQVRNVSLSEKSKNHIPYANCPVTTLLFPSTRRTWGPCQWGAKPKDVRSVRLPYGHLGSVTR